MPTSAINLTFAGGEVAPELYNRADQTKYQSGLAQCQNFLVQRFGTLTNRAGTVYLGPCAQWISGAKASRMLPFIYSASVTYVLELTHQRFRLLADGAYVTVTPTAWSNVTAYVIGDLVSLSGTNYYCRQAHTNQSPPSAAYWMAMTGSYLEVPTPWSASDLPLLQTVQSADVVTATHQSYQPYEIRRYSGTKWTVQRAAIVPSIIGPTSISSTVGVAGAEVYLYKVTAVGTDTFEESLAGTIAPKVITGITLAATAVVTSVAHGFANGDEVALAAVVGMVEINGLYATVANVTANTFELLGVDSSAWTAYVSGGTAAKTAYSVTCGVPGATTPNVVSWTASAGAGSYNVYRAINGVFGFIGIAQGASFRDTGINPSTSYTPPTYRNPFIGSTSLPACVAYYQQRLMFANTTAKPETIWGSRIGNFRNFTMSLPVQDDDAVTWTMAGRQVQTVRHMIELGKLIVFTDAGVWTIEGDTDGALKPTAINPKQQAYGGVGTVPPEVVQNTVIYASARGAVLRDLRYDFQADGYQGRDLTAFAPHLFQGRSIVRIAYQEMPHSVLWVVRDDGVLLGLTYVREHDIWAWHRHVTDGLVLDACVVPEGDEDALYLIVQRTINGVVQRYIEHVAGRTVEDLAVDAHFVDCGVVYNGRNATATTLTASGGSTWAYGESFTLTASAALFSGGDVGKSWRLTGADALTVDLLVMAYGSSTSVTVTPATTVPASLRAVATATWSALITTMSGLSHLEGKTVAILADAAVLSPVVVSGGAVALGRAYAVVHAGLPYTSRAQTLDLATVQAETLVDKQKIIPRVTLSFKDSRGGFAGSDPAGATLREVKQTPGSSVFGAPIGLYSGTADVDVGAQWSRTGRVTVEQRDPLPMTLLAIIPRLEQGGT
jgi:hypothetical protein